MCVTLTDTPAGPRIHVPMNLKRRSGRKRIVMPEAPMDTVRDAEPPAGATYRDAMLIAIARAFRWKKLLDEGKYGSIQEMANHLGVERSYMARLVRLTLLAPDIVETILMGKEPSGLSLATLTKSAMPAVWEEQRLAIQREA